ncbi:MAG: hypothetical protein AAF725_15300, partial [Acidobacteriota bacterium]
MTAPTAAPDAPLLRLDPNSLWLASEDSLQLINQRGSFDLQAKNLHRLHALLTPHLDGRFSEAELLAAVDPAQAPAVRSYLTKIRESGGFVAPSAESADGEALPLEDLGAASARGDFHAGGRRLAVDLWGGSPPQRGSFLFFVERSRAAEWLAGLRRLEESGTESKAWQTLVLVEDKAGPQRGELEKRAAVARWILSGAAGPAAESGRLQIFELPPGALSVRRLVSIDPRAGNGESGRYDSDASGSVGLATLADQLDLFTSEDVEQLPLSVARVRPSWLGDGTPWRYGLHYDSVRDALLTDFLVGLASTRGSAAAGDFFEGAIGEPRGGLRRRAAASGPVTHAARREDLLIDLLEQREAGRAAGPWSQIDLLEAPPASAP